MLRSEQAEGGYITVSPDPAAADRKLDREALAETVLAYQQELGAPENAIAGAKALALPGSSVVVTGQQPGLLGGPLLTVAKALTAIAWAERLAAESGRPVVPVFWAATEDHDVDEVNRLDILTATDERHRLSLPLAPDGTMLSHVVPPADAVDALLADLAANLPGVDRKTELMADLAATRAPSLGDWFVRILSRWLGPFGLVIVEPRILRRAAAPVLAMEHERPGAILKRIGPGPVTPAAVPFFNVEDGRRRRPDGDLAEDPEAVSWDVFTRVLAQDVALPVAGQVVGPTEMLYCAQAGPAHELFGIAPPPLIPRVSLTLVEKKVEKALGRFGASAPSVIERGEAALRANDPRPGDFHTALMSLEEALDDAWTRIHDEAGRLDETLLRKARGSEKQIMKAIDGLRDQGRKAMERVTGQDGDRRSKVLSHLLPSGKPQDRILSPLPFIARHGDRLFGKLLEVVKRHPAGDRVVYLSGKE